MSCSVIIGAADKTARKLVVCSTTYPKQPVGEAVDLDIKFQVYTMYGLIYVMLGAWQVQLAFWFILHSFLMQCRLILTMQSKTVSLRSLWHTMSVGLDLHNSSIGCRGEWRDLSKRRHECVLKMWMHVWPITIKPASAECWS